MFSRWQVVLAVGVAPLCLVACGNGRTKTLVGAPTGGLSTSSTARAAGASPAPAASLSTNSAASTPGAGIPGATPALTLPPAATGSAKPPVAVSSTPRATVPTLPVTCSSAHLALRTGPQDHAAGSTEQIYYLRNTGTTSCRMFGFPGVAYLDSVGRIIQRPADRNDVAPTAFALAPGARAQFVIRTSDPYIPGTGCSLGWHTVSIQVYPPNQTQRLLAPSMLGVCDLLVNPVQPVG